MFYMLNLLLLLVFGIGGVVFQIFLAKRKNKWFGLILPAICLLFSIIAVLSLSIYTSKEITLQQVAPDGTVIEEQIIEKSKEPIVKKGPSIFQILAVFLLYNIPTAILLIIYFACRENIRKNSLLAKMNIQDLE